MRHTIHTLRNLIVLFALAAAAPAWGALILATDPLTGTVAVQPGETTGWGFTLLSTDSNYYVLTGVEFCIGAAAPGVGTCNDTPVGTFTDFASAVNGLIIAPAGPAYSPSPYTEAFDGLLQTGLGSYLAFPTTSPQALIGTLYVYYDLYGGDPGAGGDQLGAGLSISHPAQVTIAEATTATPEPSSLLLVSFAAAAFLLKRKLA